MSEVLILTEASCIPTASSLPRIYPEQCKRYPKDRHKNNKRRNQTTDNNHLKQKIGRITFTTTENKW